MSSIPSTTSAQRLALLLNNSGGVATQEVNQFIRESGYRKDVIKPGVCSVAWAILIYQAIWEVAPLVGDNVRESLILLVCGGLLSIVYALCVFDEKLRTYLFLLKPFTKAPGACRQFNEIVARWPEAVLAVERPLYGVDLIVARERFEVYTKKIAAEKEKQECAQAHAHVNVRVSTV